MNPLVSQLWNKYTPLPNDLTAGDTVNTQDYLSPIALPQRSSFAVARIDHDFGDKWHFMASYRYYGFYQLTSQQLAAACFRAALWGRPRPALRVRRSPRTLWPA